MRVQVDGSPGRPGGETPVILYSVSRLLIPAMAGALVGAGLLAWGVAQGAAAGIAGGAAALALAGVFALGTRAKRGPGAVALARENAALVGGELPRALPLAATTFTIRPDFEGSWVIVEVAAAPAGQAAFDATLGQVGHRIARPAETHSRRRPVVVLRRQLRFGAWSCSSALPRGRVSSCSSR